MVESSTLLNLTRTYQPDFMASKMDTSFKVDEGYSEESRSQDDLDSPMRLESISDETLTVPITDPPALPPAILALSEAERSGRLDFRWALGYLCFDG